MLCISIVLTFVPIKKKTKLKLTFNLRTMSQTTLNTLISKRDANKASFVQFLKDLLPKFKSGVLFSGKRVSSTAIGDYVLTSNDNQLVIPAYNSEQVKKVIVDSVSTNLTNLMNIDATNCSGTAKVELKVDGNSYGNLSALELLQLRGFLMNNEFISVLKSFPVRPTDKSWVESTDSEVPTGTYENLVFEGQNKTTLKRTIILQDPNAEHYKSGVTVNAVTTTIDTVVPTMDQRSVVYSTGIAYKEQVAILEKRQRWLSAVMTALSEVNATPVVVSEFDVEKMMKDILKVED